MNKIFSNSNRRRDFLRFELEKLGKDEEVSIAVAFFTNADFIKKIISNNCVVRLVVRLGFPTSAEKLREIMQLSNVYIRFYTAREFHPKLYIFGNKIAFVGSSNLTRDGIHTNQELNITIDSEDPSFEELKIIFAEYWNTAKPLTNEDLKKYSSIVSTIENSHYKAEKEILSRIGEINFPNITRLGLKKKSKSQIYSDAFLKRYQLFLGEFKNLKEIYKHYNQRKIDEDLLPLRIEIDQFLSWIREKKAFGELYQEAPLRKGDDSIIFINPNIQEFIESPFQHIHHVSQYSYPLIRSNLASLKTIENMSKDDIIETIWVINAFSTRARYYGGKEFILEAFMKDNSIDRIKNTFKYLIFGKGDFTLRIAECVYSPDYKLVHFSTSCIEEMFGWANDLDIPICNERTFKSMQWLGFGKM